jgi:antitoxin ChpS
MLAIPKPVAEALDLTPDSSVELSVRSGKLVIEPNAKRRYSLDALLAECKPSARASAEDRVWTSGGARGRELI